jgi:hypothetical protein
MAHRTYIFSNKKSNVVLNTPPKKQQALRKEGTYLRGPGLSLSVSFFVLFSSDFFLSSSSYLNQDPKKHGDEDNKAEKQR